jgi:peptide/nickel transport system permease protein
MSIAELEATEILTDAPTGGLWSEARYRLIRNPTAIAGAVLVLIFATAAIFAPLIAPYGPLDQNLSLLKAGGIPPGPSLHHLLGVDLLGRDVFTRIVYGARFSLLIGVVSVAIGLAAGLVLGAVAGYVGGAVESVIMRCMDVMLAFPGLLLALVIVTILGRGLGNVIVAIGVSYIPVFARIVYASTLAARGKEYVLAVRVMGARASRIMGRHILPNVTQQIVVIATSAIGWALLLAATLNFLGFGVKLPTAEWGADLSAGREWLGPAWWISTFPGMAIAVTILAVNFLGDAVGGSAIDARTIEEPQQAVEPVTGGAP